MSANTIITITGAALIACGASLFGIGMARVFWAQDLMMTLERQQSWDRMKASLQNTIDSLRRTIETQQEINEIQKRTIETLRGKSP